MDLPKVAMEFAVGLAGPIAVYGLDKLLNRGHAAQTERIRAFVDDLADRLKKVEAKCEPERFYVSVVKSIRAMESGASKDKIGIFKLVLQGLYQGEIDDHHSRLFLSFTERLDVPHIHLLAVMRHEVPPVAASEHGSAAFGYDFLLARTTRILDSAEPESQDICTLVLYELSNSGLMHLRMSDDRRGRLMTTNAMDMLLRRQVYWLSPLGLKYAKYIERANTKPV